MIDHLTSKVAYLQRLGKPGPGDLVLDIGSNDATTLKAYTTPNLRRIGIDPTGSVDEGARLRTARDAANLPHGVRFLEPDLRARRARPRHRRVDPRRPATFYGHSKSWSMDLLAFLRRESGLHASSAILFNHESPLRRPQFVSRKVTRAAAAARLGQALPRPELHNVGARVDWCSARDVVRGLRLMADAEEPQDYVVGSGELHSVRDLLQVAFGHVGLDWRHNALAQRPPKLCTTGASAGSGAARLAA